MSNLEKKKDHELDKIVVAIEKLDDELGKIDALEGDNKKHHIKRWVAEKKALHEIKKILHDAKKYDKYDDKELEKIEKLAEAAE